MYSFIAPLLVVLSLTGIVVVLLRKTPEVNTIRKKIMPKSPDSPTEFLVYTGRAVGRGLEKIWDWLAWGGQRLWIFVLGAKEISKRSGIARFPKKFSGIGLKTPKISFFLSPDSPEFYIAKAKESEGSDNLEQAEQQYIKAIEKDPGSEDSYSGLGSLYLGQKKFADARETFDFLIKHRPENDSYHANLAQTLHGLKKYKQAVKAYNKAIKLNPDGVRRFVNLGITLEAMDKLDEAVVMYKKAVDLEGTNVNFLTVLAEGYAKQEELEAAEEILKRVLELEPTNHSAREKLMKLKF